MTVTELPDDLTADDLRRVAKRLGLPKTLTSRLDLVQAVEQYLEKHLDSFLVS